MVAASWLAGGKLSRQESLCVVWPCPGSRMGLVHSLPSKYQYYECPGWGGGCQINHFVAPCWPNDLLIDDELRWSWLIQRFWSVMLTYTRQPLWPWAVATCNMCHCCRSLWVQQELQQSVENKQRLEYTVIVINSGLVVFPIRHWSAENYRS